VSEAGSGAARAAVSYDDFEKIDVRVGTVIDARPFEGARKPAIQLWVDFGAPIGVRKSSAQITRYYTPQDVIGRQVAAVVNFPPRQIGKFMSEILVLGFPDSDGAVVMIGPDRPVPNGGKLF
jgi:tRNA-binding protein